MEDIMKRYRSDNVTENSFVNYSQDDDAEAESSETNDLQQIDRKGNVFFECSFIDAHCLSSSSTANRPP